MYHPFDKRHGGPTGACNKNKGIMSYAHPANGNWSTCAVKDFTAHYNLITKSGKWCMEGNIFY